MSLEAKVIKFIPDSGMAVVKFRNSTSARNIDDYPAVSMYADALTEAEAIEYLQISGQGIADQQDKKDAILGDANYANFFSSRVGYIITLATIEDDLKSPLSEGQLSLEMGTKTFLENLAKSAGYDSIISACSYASVDNPYQKQSIEFVKLRSKVWQIFYDRMDAVSLGATGMPTLSSLLDEYKLLTLI
jgi:hypothetical protein